jgi:excisionase family DNA binding protein
MVDNKARAPILPDKEWLPDGRPLLNIDEACDILRVSRWTLYRLINERRLETIKIGSRRLVPVQALQDLIERLREEPIT